MIHVGSNDLLQMSPPQAEVVVERMRALLAWLLVRRGAVGGPDAISSGRPAPHAPGRLGGG